jgi:hypothetical protein
MTVETQGLLERTRLGPLEVALAVEEQEKDGDMLQSVLDAQLAKALWACVGWLEENEGKDGETSLSNRLACAAIDGGVMPLEGAGIEKPKKYVSHV